MEAPRDLRRREQQLRDGHVAQAILGGARLDVARRQGVRNPRARDQRQRHRAHGQDRQGRRQARRNGDGPTFIDAHTYRYKGHSISDPAKYRRKEEVDSAVNHDPIVAYQHILLERGWIDQEETDAMVASVKDEVDQSIEFAEASEPPPLKRLYEDITVGPYIPQE